MSGWIPAKNADLGRARVMSAYNALGIRDSHQDCLAFAVIQHKPGVSSVHIDTSVCF